MSSQSTQVTSDYRRLSIATYNQPYIDEVDMHLKVVGWHEYRRQKRYLVQYSRPEIPNRSTHALIDGRLMPQELLSGFHHPTQLNISHISNRGGLRIRLHNITQVLDLASCEYGGSSEVECERRSDEHHGYFYDFFLLLQWKDEDGISHITWEFAQTWMDLLETNHGLSLLGRWVWEVEHRHDQLVLGESLENIEQVLGRPGWQYA